MIHLLHALEHGYSTCLVRTVDTDVVGIVIGSSMPCSPCPYCRHLGRFWHWQELHMSSYKCHLSFSGQRNVRSTSHFPLLHRLWHNLSILQEGEEISMGGLVFLPWGHSGLQLHGSKWAFSLDNRWSHFKLLERYTFVIYDKTSHSGSINEARRELFCQKNKTMEHIQPTQDSMLQQSKRVAYQSGIWATCEMAHQPTPSPEGCVWTLDGDSNVRRPVWSTLSMASKACLQLGKCGCCRSASGCGGRSLCKKTHSKCTEPGSCICDR